MIPSAPPRQRSSERGEITWVTLVLILALVTGGYLAVVWAPVYIVRYEAGVLATEYANKAVHNRDDAQLVQDALFPPVHGWTRSRSRRRTARSPCSRPSICAPSDVTWVRNTDATPPTIHVAFEYTTSVYFPVLDRFSEKTFAIDRFQDIQPAKW